MLKKIVNKKNDRNKNALLTLLQDIDYGTLTLQLPDSSKLSFGQGEPVAHLIIKDDQVFSEIMRSGDIGFGESYIHNLWDTPDLTALLTLLNMNRASVKSTIHGHKWHLLSYWLKHKLRANTRYRVRKNIISHYDLGNEFFKLWLDGNMNYSSAWFNDQDVSLYEAQLLKHKRILDKLNASTSDSILDIGCGWGSFLKAASDQSFKNLSGVTISPSQWRYAKQVLPDANLKLRDYRDLKDIYDRIVSIEMFEAVGERWWKTYFRTIYNQLRRGGSALIQAIVIKDHLFPRYRKQTDFLQQYIFPGGMLPSVNAFTKLAHKCTLDVKDCFFFGQDYAKTLRIWHKNFDQQWLKIKQIGFDEKFRRLWKYYLSYCEAGFVAGSIDVCQFQLQKN